MIRRKKTKATTLLKNPTWILKKSNPSRSLKCNRYLRGTRIRISKGSLLGKWRSRPRAKAKKTAKEMFMLIASKT